MFKLVSWNIRQGGGRRIASITKWIRQSNAHVIALSEFRNNQSSGAILRAKLKDLGYIYQSNLVASGHANGAFIASMVPCEFRVLNTLDDTFQHHVIAADLEPFTIISVYLPHKKKHQLFQELFQEIKSNPKPVIITGDYNTGFNGVDQKGKSFWYQPEMETLSQLDMLDAFRLKHGDLKEYSWYSHQGNGFRYDHTYISKDLESIVSDCYYDHEIREDNISDHSPMILELG